MQYFENVFKIIIHFGIIYFLKLDNVIVVAKGCELNLHPEYHRRPNFFLSANNVTIRIPKNRSFLILGDLDTIRGNCDTYFDKIYDYSRYKNINDADNLYFICDDGKFYTSYGGQRFSIQSDAISCAEMTWNLYESSVAFVDLKLCHNSASKLYFIGAKRNVLAAFCYDWSSEPGIKSIFYLKGQNAVSAKNTKKNFVFNTPTIDQDEIFENMTVNLEEAIKTDVDRLQRYRSYLNPVQTKDPEDELNKQNSWLSYDNFMEAPLVDKFETFEWMLMINWWPSLLYGNWRRFMRTLEDHTIKTGKVYRIFQGHTDYVSVPVIQKNVCDKNNIENAPVVNFVQLKRLVPKYIWMYIESMDADEQFVVVAYNAPFVDYFLFDEIVFCTNICKNIDWLKNAQKSFGYQALGLMFCCTLEELHAKRALKNFPYDQFQSFSMRTTTSKNFWNGLEDLSNTTNTYESNLFTSTTEVTYENENYDDEFQEEENEDEDDYTNQI